MDVTPLEGKSIPRMPANNHDIIGHGDIMSTSEDELAHIIEYEFSKPAFISVS